MARWSTTRCSATTPTRSRSRRWSASTRSAPTGCNYSFTLRDGLKFHDGSPVTTKDVIASLKRWGAKDGVGQRLMGYVTEMKAVDDKTFTMALKEPYGMVLESLGKSGSSIAAIMREKEALTDPQQQVKESIGSGPFVFAKDQWVPGSKAVYLKNKDYIPRTRGAVGLRRRQDPGRRPHRADLDARSTDGDAGADQRRDRLLGESQQRLPAACSRRPRA